jgi:hypothetical protein
VDGGGAGRAPQHWPIAQQRTVGAGRKSPVDAVDHEWRCLTMASDGRSVDHCRVCGRVVLGLQGQDAFLEPYLLRQDSSDETAVIADIIGPCHLKCLLGSGAGAFWASRMKERYVLPHHARTVRADEESLACYTKFTKAVTIVRADGWCATLAAKSLGSARPRAGGCVIVPGKSESRIPADIVSSGDQLLPASFDFGILIDRLGIRGDLLWPEVAAEALVRSLGRTEKGSDSVTVHVR